MTRLNEQTTQRTQDVEEKFGGRAQMSSYSKEAKAACIGLSIQSLPLKQEQSHPVVRIVYRIKAI
jgi:hypothetical protein